MPSSLDLLVADDDPDMRNTMALLLQHAGHKVRLAANGAHALALQRERPADVLITDLFMPDMDGLEAIERFRAEFPGVRIVAMSGGGTHVRGQHYLATALVAGAVALLRKPFDVDVLLTLLESIARARNPGAA